MTTAPEVDDGSLEVFFRGDMNGNEALDLQDLVLILRIALNLVPFSSALQLARADVDENRLIYLNNALFVIRNLTGRPNGLPVRRERNRSSSLVHRWRHRQECAFPSLYRRMPRLLSTAWTWGSATIRGDGPQYADALGDSSGVRETMKMVLLK